MSIFDYFKPVPGMTAEEVRDLLNRKDPGEYNLVDVRQLQEYERGHLPGARLIPVSELPARARELDQHKTTIVY